MMSDGENYAKTIGELYRVARDRCPTVKVDAADQDALDRLLVYTSATYGTGATRPSLRRVIGAVARAHNMRLHCVNRLTIPEFVKLLDAVPGDGAGTDGTASQTTLWDRVKKRAWNTRLVVAFLIVLAAVVGVATLVTGLETIVNLIRRFIVWLSP
jgi:hypothetical protein